MFEKKTKIDNFEQYHSAKRCKRGTLWDCCKNLRRIEGVPFGVIKKFRE